MGWLAGSEQSKTVTLRVLHIEQLVMLPKITFFGNLIIVWLIPSYQTTKT